MADKRLIEKTKRWCRTLAGVTATKARILAFGNKIASNSNRLEFIQDIRPFKLSSTKH